MSVLRKAGSRLDPSMNDYLTPEMIATRLSAASHVLPPCVSTTRASKSAGTINGGRAGRYVASHTGPGGLVQ
jgi:hypothetical protein